MKRNIIFYKNINQKCPIEEFLDNLDDIVVSKILAVFKYIEELLIIPDKYFKKLSNTDIYEIRIKAGNRIFRILCFFHKNSQIILTNGFQKKSQKTPKKEIIIAEKYKEDYLRRIKWVI